MGDKGRKHLPGLDGECARLEVTHDQKPAGGMRQNRQRFLHQNECPNGAGVDPHPGAFGVIDAEENRGSIGGFAFTDDAAIRGSIRIPLIRRIVFFQAYSAGESGSGFEEDLRGRRVARGCPCRNYIALNGKLSLEVSIIL